MDQYSKYVKQNKPRRVSALKGRSTAAMTIDMYKALSASVTKDAEGYAVYADGVSDATIAADIGCSEHTVGNMRTKHFGKLKSNILPPYGELIKRVHDLEARLASLETQLGITR